MSSRLEDTIKDLVERKAAEWRPDQKAQAIRVAADLAQLSARHLAGEDVEGELAHAKAAAANIAARGSVQSAAIFQEGFALVLDGLIRAAVG